MELWDVNKPVANPKLTELLEKRANLSPESEEYGNVMNEALKYVATEGYFLSVVDIDDANIEQKDDGSAVLKKDTSIRFERLAAQDGRFFFPVYTDWENLRASGHYGDAQVKTMIFTFDDIAAIVLDKGDGAVINPFTHNLTLTNEMLGHMKKVKVGSGTQQSAHEEIIQKDTKVGLGEPKEYPTEMVEAIKEYAKTNRTIKAIWLKLMMKGDEKSFLFIVDLDGPKEIAFNGIVNAGRPFLPKDMFIDLIPYNTDFGVKAADNEPFYKKKRLMFG